MSKSKHTEAQMIAGLKQVTGTQARQPRCTHRWWAVHTDTPNFLAKSLYGMFCRRLSCLRARISPCVRLRIGGRPSTLPLARAFPNPDFTLSEMRLRSNCATAPIIWNTSSPAGNEVSTDSVTETKVDSKRSARFETRDLSA